MAFHGLGSAWPQALMPRQRACLPVGEDCADCNTLKSGQSAKDLLPQLSSHALPRDRRVRPAACELLPAPTMLVLSTERRMLLAEKLSDAANLAAGAMIFGQFLGERIFSPTLTAFGFAIWLVMIGCAVALTPRRDSYWASTFCSEAWRYSRSRSPRSIGSAGASNGAHASSTTSWLPIWAVTSYGPRCVPTLGGMGYFAP